MGASRPAFDVLLAGFFGFGNLGDELLALAAVDNLVHCGLPRERIAILSNDPSGSQQLLGVHSFDRWKFTSVLRAISNSRSMLLAGGGLFQDSTSTRSCFYYWGLVRLAGIKSLPVAALGQSVGPLSGSVSKFLTRDAFSRCAYIAARDSLSVETLSNMFLSCEKMPDPVMSLSVPEVKKDGDDAVLINIRPQPCGKKYIEAVLAVARICAKHGMKLLCAAMAPEDARLMEKYRVSGELPKCEIVNVTDLAGFSELASLAGYAVGMRLHFGILSMLAGLGVVLAPYDPKVSSFAQDWGVKLLNFEDIVQNFDIMKLLTNSRFRDKRKTEEIRLLVAGQFDTALGRILGDDDGHSKKWRT
jgi:polysaccharide pyruvyl transferase CsaB